MGRITRNVQQKRDVDEYVALFFHIVDQGYEDIDLRDQRIFNIMRKAVLDLPYTETDQGMLIKYPILNKVFPLIKAKCRQDHIERLEGRLYLRQGHVSKDFDLLADIFIDYVHGEDMREKYSLDRKYNIYGMIQQIRQSRSYEEARNIIRQRGVDINTKRAKRTIDECIQPSNKKLSIEETAETTYDSSISTSSITSDMASTNVSAPEFINQYIIEQEKIIIKLEEQLINHKNNIKIAREFAARLS